MRLIVTLPDEVPTPTVEQALTDLWFAISTEGPESVAEYTELES